MNAFLASADGIFTGVVGLAIGIGVLVLCILWILLPVVIISSLNDVKNELAILREETVRLGETQVHVMSGQLETSKAYGRSMERHITSVHMALAPDAYEEKESF